MGEKCTYPNYFKRSLSDHLDIETVKAFEPTSILIVKVISAENLAKKDGVKGFARSLIGQNKPDPYAKISIGAISHLTEVEKNNQNPNWNENE